MNKNLSIDEKVRNFYETLPFNIYGDLDTAVERVKKTNLFKIYPVLKNVFEKHEIKNIIDFGCGGGWLINSLAYNNYPNVYGLDLSKATLKYASDVSKKLKLKTTLINSNIFEFETNLKFDLLISLGVLHHTNNCLKALNHICKFASDKSFIFLGLYHKYGRKPFLDFVRKLNGMSEQEKFRKYKQLHKLTDEKHLYSWFRDQVLHPHETQHTYEEIHFILSKKGFNIVSTSINNFEPFNSDNKIIEKEKELYEYGLMKIKKNQYYPGFFIILAKNF